MSSFGTGTSSRRGRPPSGRRLQKLRALAARENESGRTKVRAVLTQKLLQKVPNGASKAVRALVDEEVTQFLAKHPRISKRALTRLEQRVTQRVSQLPLSAKRPVATDGAAAQAAMTSAGAVADGAQRGNESAQSTAEPAGETPGPEHRSSQAWSQALSETKGREWLLLDTYSFVKGEDSDTRKRDARRRDAQALTAYLRLQVSQKQDAKEAEQKMEREYARTSLQDVEVYKDEESVALKQRKALMLEQKAAQERQVQDNIDRAEQERLEQEHDDSIQVEWSKMNLERERQQRIENVTRMRGEAAEVRAGVPSPP